MALWAPAVLFIYFFCLYVCEVIIQALWLQKNENVAQQQTGIYSFCLKLKWGEKHNKMV